MNDQEKYGPILKKYRVEFINTALGQGHYNTCTVEAEDEEDVPVQFYKTKRSFCKIKTITEVKGA